MKKSKKDGLVPVRVKYTIEDNGNKFSLEMECQDGKGLTVEMIHDCFKDVIDIMQQESSGSQGHTVQ